MSLFSAKNFINHRTESSINIVEFVSRNYEVNTCDLISECDSQITECQKILYRSLVGTSNPLSIREAFNKFYVEENRIMANLVTEFKKLVDIYVDECVRSEYSIETDIIDNITETCNIMAIKTPYSVGAFDLKKCVREAHNERTKVYASILEMSNAFNSSISESKELLSEGVFAEKIKLSPKQAVDAIVGSDLELNSIKKRIPKLEKAIANSEKALAKFKRLPEEDKLKKNIQTKVLKSTTLFLCAAISFSITGKAFVPLNGATTSYEEDAVQVIYESKRALHFLKQRKSKLEKEAGQ